MGSYSIQLPGDSSIILDPCYFVPSCNKNIISVSSLGTEGYIFKFGNNLCSIYYNDALFARGVLDNGLYILDLSRPMLCVNDKKRKENNSDQLMLWHHRLSHINKRRIAKLVREGLNDSFDPNSIDTCESCFHFHLLQDIF